MDVERCLLTKVVEEQNILPALERKVSPAWFSDPENREFWTYLSGHFTTYGTVPSPATIETDWPTFKPVEAGEPFEFYVDRMAQHRKLVLLTEPMVEAAQAYDSEDPDKLLAIIQQAMVNVATEVSALRDVDLTSSWKERVEHYRAVAERKGRLAGYPMGISTIDEALNGFQAEQLITMVGLPKAGKSSLMLYAAINAQKRGAKPLFIGFEMGNEEQAARYDALNAGINHMKLTRGSITPSELDALEKRLKKNRHGESFILSADISSTTTVSGIRAKVEQYDPDIVFVDGVYMMDDEAGEPKGSPAALTNITRSFKRLAQATKKPVVISTQALEWKTGRRGLTSGSIGYSSSFVQDSDAVLGIENVDEDDLSLKRVKILAARSAMLDETLIHWDWETGTVTEMDADMGLTDLDDL